MPDHAITALRDLAKEFVETAHKPEQDERRELWRSHNSFHSVRTPIYIRAFAFAEWFDESQLVCTDPLLRFYEAFFHRMRFRDSIGDDFIIEPWITVGSVYEPPVEKRWGVPTALGEKPHSTGAAAFRPELQSEEDFHRLTPPQHRIDERATEERVSQIHDVIGDIVEIHVDRGPMLTMWTGDISTDIAKLRGLEQVMWDAYDRPEWLHKLLAFMRDSILRVQETAEASQDISLANSQNQAMPYARELADPRPNSHGARRQDIWGYMAAQEYTGFGPAMFDEFLLQYQMPIIEAYGLSAYGCCEDLTHKIDKLRQIKNLRRIAVAPAADARRCAEQIGREYILSWRPNPSSMIATGLDEDFVRQHVREHVHCFRQNRCQFDITLKDVETVNRQPDNVRRWTTIVREVLEEQ